MMYTFLVLVDGSLGSDAELEEELFATEPAPAGRLGKVAKRARAGRGGGGGKPAARAKSGVKRKAPTSAATGKRQKAPPGPDDLD